VTTEDAALLAELEALEKEEQRRARYSDWCPHHPHPKQQAFLSIDAQEALYGGAASGGKSDALLMAALQYVHVPGYAALILRRTYADLSLPGAIMDRSHGWLQGTKASWNDRDKRWTFPSGATLTFGYLDTDKDRFRYASSEFQFIGFDELTQFPEAWYRFLFSRLRKTSNIDAPLRMRAATNPGGIGHEWVRRRFLDPGDPGRPFIPARVEDNPSVDAKGYLASLAQLDENTRRQLQDGVWITDASGLVYRKPTTLQVRPTAGEWTYLLGVDFGVKDAMGYVVLGHRENDRNVYVLESFKETQSDVTQAAERVLAFDEQYRFAKIVGDLGGMGKAFGEEFQRRHRIPIEPAQKQNKRGYIGLLNGAIERKELVVIEPTNSGLIKEMAELPWKDESHQAEADGFDNHTTDALLYAWRATNAFSQKLPTPPVDDPLERIRREVAEVWARHEADVVRSAAQSQMDDYDLGSKWLDQGDN